MNVRLQPQIACIERNSRAALYKFQLANFCASLSFSPDSTTLSNRATDAGAVTFPRFSRPKQRRSPFFVFTIFTVNFFFCRRLGMVVASLSSRQLSAPFACKTCRCTYRHAREHEQITRSFHSPFRSFISTNLTSVYSFF